MGTAIDRAQFLRGDFRGERSPVRPPWAIEEARFVDACTRCGECLSACPQKVLQKGRGGFPEVNFRHGECTFCRACLERCATGALFASEPSPPWLLTVRIGEQCLALHGVVCRTCGEQCETQALRFRPVIGRVPVPEINVAACNGCGACVAPCPAAAVTLHKTAPTLCGTTMGGESQ